MPTVSFRTNVSLTTMNKREFNIITNNKFTFNIVLRWTLQATDPHDSLGYFKIEKSTKQ